MATSEKHIKLSLFALWWWRWGHGWTLLTCFLVNDTLSCERGTEEVCSSKNTFMGFCEWISWQGTNHTTFEEKGGSLTLWHWGREFFLGVERERKRVCFDWWMVWKWVWWCVSSTVVNVSPSTHPLSLRDSLVCITASVFLQVWLLHAFWVFQEWHHQGMPIWVIGKHKWSIEHGLCLNCVCGFRQWHWHQSHPSLSSSVAQCCEAEAIWEWCVEWQVHWCLWIAFAQLTTSATTSQHHHPHSPFHQYTHPFLDTVNCNLMWPFCTLMWRFWNCCDLVSRRNCLVAK